MTAEEALDYLVRNDSTLNGLIGGRFYPLVIPQKAAMPACAYQRITTGRECTHDGPSGLAEPRIQITIQAATYTSAKTIASAMRQKLNGHNAKVSGVRTVIFLENEYDGYNLETEIKTVRQDYRVMIYE